MINLKDLGFSYQRRTPVFTGLTLSIPAGRSVGVLGANGVGKTTLIKLLAGLIAPSNGNIDVLGFTPRDRQVNFFQNLYIVPEEADIPPMTGVAYVKHFSRFYPEFNHQRLQSLEQQFEIDSRHKLTEMSLGQKKKFLIAFAMATQCQLILMDEPTNGLDIPAKSQFRNMIVSQQSDEQTFLICTHQVRDLDSIIDSVVMMNEHHAHWFDLSTLPEKISQVTVSEDDSSVLYSELRMGMKIGIVEGGLPQATDIDLEMLFNTFHTNYDGLLNAVNKEDVA